MNPGTKGGIFEKLSSFFTRAAGSTPALIFAFILILLWLITGPVFNFSQKWQLMIDNITSAITFLMVFIIQKAQNKDALAIQLKLNELIAAHDVASNMLVNAEDMSEEELRVMQKYYSRLAERHKKDSSNHLKKQGAHSLDETKDNLKIGTNVSPSQKRA